MHNPAYLVLLLFAQLVAGDPTPVVELKVPDKPVPLARFVKMEISPIEKSPTEPNNFDDISVEWVVTERSTNPNPIDTDLVIDSSRQYAFVPSGDHATTLNVTAVVTFIYQTKDDKGTITGYSLRHKKVSKEVIIGNPTPPEPKPPTPEPPTPPQPKPTPVVDLPVGVYDLANWSYQQLLKSQLSKSDAVKIALAFHQIAGMTRNGAFQTKQDVVKAMAQANKNALDTKITEWINPFLKPLETKLNSIRAKLATTTDQAVAFDEIGNGIDAYSRQPN